MTAILEARNISKQFGGGMFQGPPTRALEPFSMRIESEPPSITAVVGESGSGKTTLAQILLGILPPSTGELLYEGTPVGDLSKQEHWRFLRDVQMILQDPYESYNPFYRVDHILRVGIRRFGIAKSRTDEQRVLEEALEAVGLRPEDTLGRYPHQLSGGQRQRVMVARALAVRPRVIIADEPVSMVDASLRATILESLRTLTRDFGVSVIYITHDLTTAYQIGDNVLVMYRGVVAEAGDAELVVPEPLHPYTQLLVGSIPRPDPRRPWMEEQQPSEIGRNADPDRGCKFANRCPHAMEICLEEQPPAFQVNKHRVASCHLYQESAESEATDFTDVFVSPQRQERSDAAD
jgi:oligopeptide/dipeptide ABC transporter ATP-binding protein